MSPRFAPLAALLAVATLALACTSDTPATPSLSPTPTPEVTATPLTASPTATSEPSTQTPTPSPTPVDRTRSLEAVDQVIAAVEAGDVDALESLVRYSQIPCGGEKSNEGPPYPACDGAPLATPVDAFPAGVCDPVWHRDPRSMVERFVERAGPLFAVIEGPEQTVDYGIPRDLDLPTGDYRVIFTAEPAGEVVPYIAIVADGVLISLKLGCGKPADALLWWLDPVPPVVQQGPAFVATTLRPEPTPPPSPDLAPRGTRIGLSDVDAVLAAMESGDPTKIRLVLHGSALQCSYAQGVGGPPLCGNGELEATVIDVFLTTGCEGSWGDRDLDALADALASWGAPLYAVAAPSQWNNWYRLLFTTTPDTFSGGLLYVADGSIIGTGGGCSASPEQWASGSHIILRGPAWPADSAP